MGKYEWDTSGMSGNKWGGKNNKPPKRIGKKQQEQQENKTEYQPTKLFNVLAGGVVLFLCGVLGLDLAKAAINGIFNARDKVDEIKDTVEFVQDVASGRGETGSGSGSGSNILDTIISKNLEIDIGEEDVENMLNYLYEKITGLSKNDELIILDSRSTEKDKTFKKDVINEAEKHDSNNLTFAIMYENITTEEQAQSAVDNVNLLLSNYLEDIGNMGYENIQILGTSVKYKFAVMIVFQR